MDKEILKDILAGIFGSSGSAYPQNTTYISIDKTRVFVYEEVPRRRISSNALLDELQILHRPNYTIKIYIKPIK